MPLQRAAISNDSCLFEKMQEWFNRQLHVTECRLEETFCVSKREGNIPSTQHRNVMEYEKDNIAGEEGEASDMEEEGEDRIMLESRTSVLPKVNGVH